MLFWRLREAMRFGVTDVLVIEDDNPTDPVGLREIAAALPCPVRLAPGPRAAAMALDAPDVLVLRGEALFDGNIARLLAAAPPSGPGLRLVTQDGRDAGIAIARRGRLDPAALASLPTLALPGRLIPPGGDAAPPRHPALFLDRDGTLNIDHGYVGTRDRFEWIAGARQAVARASDAGWHVFIVTNQSGVARGLYEEDAVTALHDWLADDIRSAGGTIDDIRICPYHPEGTRPEYRRASDWRKPAPGMLRDLIRAWDLDASACLLVGDQPSDIAAAHAAGMAGHLFAGGDLDAFIRPLLRADPAAALADAAG
jgi:D-glycero-D-manno-heptose 1,7-bisphosphate phosphatase